MLGRDRQSIDAIAAAVGGVVRQAADLPRLRQRAANLGFRQLALLFGNEIEDRLFFPSPLRPRKRPRHSADDKRRLICLSVHA